MLRHKNIYRIISGLLASQLVFACTTLDPYTGEEKSSKSSAGAAIGAVAGALLGAATASTNDRKKGALIGAGVGALAGGGVGYYMDRQEQKLRQKLEGSGVSVTRDGDNIILNMPSNITFDTDSSAIKPKFNNTLDSVILVLNEFESTLITSMGHTDSTGSEQYNQALSERRALSVAEYLIGKGVHKERLAAIGYGELQPAAKNTSKSGRAQNRRVELKLEPITHTN